MPFETLETSRDLAVACALEGAAEVCAGSDAERDRGGEHASRRGAVQRSSTR